MQRVMFVPKLYLLLMASISMGIVVVQLRGATLQFDSTAEIRQVNGVGILPLGTTAGLLYERPPLSTLIGEDSWAYVQRTNDVQPVNSLARIVNDTRLANAPTFQNDQGENNDDQGENSVSRSLTGGRPTAPAARVAEGSVRGDHDDLEGAEDDGKDDQATSNLLSRSILGPGLIGLDFSELTVCALSIGGTSLSAGGEMLSTTPAIPGLPSIGASLDPLQTAPVPEPSSVVLVVTGVVALAWIRQRRIV